MNTENKDEHGPGFLRADPFFPRSSASHSIAAAILSAGESSRMGFPKALLPYRGDTFLGTLAAVFAHLNLEPLLVILGHDAERIRSGVRLPPFAQVIVNSEYKLGQLSSLQTAIRAVPDASGLLVAPVDHPCISGQTVAALLRAFKEEQPDLLVPLYKGRRGHPVIFSARLFPELLRAPADVGARAVTRRHAIREIPVNDEGILTDIDDPEIYRRAVPNR